MDICFCNLIYNATMLDPYLFLLWWYSGLFHQVICRLIDWDLVHYNQLVLSQCPTAKLASLYRWLTLWRYLTKTGDSIVKDASNLTVISLRQWHNQDITFLQICTTNVYKMLPGALLVSILQKLTGLHLDKERQFVLTLCDNCSMCLNLL